MGQLSTKWMNFHEILYLITFKKSVTKTQASLKLTRTTGTVREDQYKFLTYISLISS